MSSIMSAPWKRVGSGISERFTFHGFQGHNTRDIAKNEKHTVRNTLDNVRVLVYAGHMLIELGTALTRMSRYCPSKCLEDGFDVEAWSNRIDRFFISWRYVCPSIDLLCGKRVTSNLRGCSRLPGLVPFDACTELQRSFSVISFVFDSISFRFKSSPPSSKT